MKEKQKDLFVVILLQALGIGYAVLTKDLFIGRSLIAGSMLVVPAVIYMGIRKKKNWKKILLATLTFGLIFGAALSFYAEATQSWSTSDYIFNFRFLGLNTLEEFLGQGLMALNIFVFYEHFIDHEDWKIKKLAKYAVLAGVLGLLFLMIFYFIKPEVYDRFTYPYLVVGFIAILPTIYILITNPKILGKLLPVAAYFFFLWFIVQYFAVGYSYWSYPGDRHIGLVRIFDVEYPFEELFFWMLLYAPTLIAYYELTFDDNK
jgi:hypothetical protein